MRVSVDGWGGVMYGCIGCESQIPRREAEISPVKSTRLISSVNHWIFHKWCVGGGELCTCVSPDSSEADTHSRSQHIHLHLV